MTAGSARSAPSLILEAARTAAEAHVGQARKGTSGAPYINHPLAVAAMVAETSDDPEVLAAALLHDVVEDSEITLDDLAAAFGSRVAGIVGELTDPPETRDWPRSRRKARQAEHIGGASIAAQMIKIADQTSNLADLAAEPGALGPAEHARYREGAVAVVAACRGACPALAARFDAAVAAHRRATGSQA